MKIAKSATPRWTCRRPPSRDYSWSPCCPSRGRFARDGLSVGSCAPRSVHGPDKQNVMHHQWTTGTQLKKNASTEILECEQQAGSATNISNETARKKFVVEHSQHVDQIWTAFLQPTPRKYAFLSSGHLDFEQRALHKMTPANGSFYSSSSCPLNVEPTQYLASLFNDNFIQCIYHDIKCAQEKECLHSSLNFIHRVHMAMATRNAGQRTWRPIRISNLQQHGAARKSDHN